jgi:hypothetical protein
MAFRPGYVKAVPAPLRAARRGCARAGVGAGRRALLQRARQVGRARLARAEGVRRRRVPRGIHARPAAAAAAAAAAPGRGAPLRAHTITGLTSQGRLQGRLYRTAYRGTCAIQSSR